MGPGNMGAPYGGVIVLFFAAGCVIQVVIFAVALIVLAMLKRHRPARTLIPVAVTGLVLCLPVTIASLYFLLFLQQYDGFVDYGFVAIWMVVSAFLCWMLATHLCKLTTALKKHFRYRNEAD